VLRARCCRCGAVTGDGRPAARVHLGADRVEAGANRSADAANAAGSIAPAALRRCVGGLTRPLLARARGARAPVNEPNSLVLVRFNSLRRAHGVIGLGGDVSALAWIGPHRLAALVGTVLCCPAQLRIVIADLRAGRIVGERSLPATVLVICRVLRGLVLLMAPKDAIGPASLITVDAV
jgi:hypothetical protein